MIEIKGLVKNFGDIVALDGVNMNVQTGSVYGLVGPNGCGKTTTIKHVLGVYRQDDGNVMIDGEDVWENTQAKQKIAAIPDDWFFFPSATIKDMMEFYKGFYRNFSEARFKKFGEIFQIPHSRRISTLSRGMKKQVAFWLSLSTMPEYLILDEPVDGLDPSMRRQVWSLVVDDVFQRGMTVLVSSHNLRELEDVCSYVGIMKNGRIEIERSLTKLQDNMTKLQLVFPDGRNEFPKDIPVLNISRMGRVFTVILRMSAKEAEERLAPYEPVMMEAMPLTLEEIFIYEVGGQSSVL